MTETHFSFKSAKAAILIFLPLFILTSGILWGFCFLELKSKKENLQSQSTHTIQLQKHIVSNSFDLIVSDLLFFSNYSQLLTMLEEPGIAKERLSSDLALFSMGAKIYDQLRIISADGRESIRVNYLPNKGPVIIKEDALQLKKDRYYFQDTFSLSKGEIYVSPLDLNIEHGKIETPLKPMIRFGTPIFDRTGTKRGIIIFNYLAINLIRDINNLAPSSSQCMLLNSDGYWLFNKSNPELEWGFMFKSGNGNTIKNKEPALWENISAENNGQFFSEKGLYTFTTIYPLLEGWQSSTGSGQAFAQSKSKKKAKEYYWKLVSHLPEDQLPAGADKIRNRYTLLNLLLLIMFAILCFRYMRAKFIEEQALADLNRSRDDLERQVQVRTEELVTANNTFQAIVESTVGHVGQNFFNNLVVKLVGMLGCNCAIIGRLNGPDTMKALAVQFDEKTNDDYSYSLQGTPCENVTQKGFCHYPDNVCGLFPEDIDLARMNAVGYVGVPVVGSTGEVIGVLCAISRSRLDLPSNAESLMNILAGRAAVEIERIEREQESRQLTRSLQQAQRMEAIGTLAGGIAHDFNNILSIILGYTEMAKEDAPTESPYSEELANVLLAGQRAKELIRQILTFSRQTEVKKISLRPQPIIREALKMLRSSLPTTIEIKENIIKNCGTTYADPTQLHQVVMNLCTNAFHAMEQSGGVLSVQLSVTENIPLELKSRTNNTSDNFIVLSISDTGKGIAPEIIDKIFDPFFTTKEQGKGTGLGLATTYSIVKEHGGAITVESQLNVGTAFHVYLPIAEEEAVPVSSDDIIAPKGKGQILLVDDEKQLANMHKKTLERLGYQVTVKNKSPEALEAFRARPNAFDLVITDQTMPFMTGIELTRKILEIRPEFPIILCSGYSSQVNEEVAKASGVREFVNKPVNKGTFAKLIQKVLNGEG